MDAETTMLARARVVALGLVAAAFVAALVHVSGALNGIGHDRAELAAIAPADRPLVGAFSTDIDRGFLQAAKRQIPPDASYYVLTGSKVQVSSPTTLTAVAPYAGYWLLPRVQVTDPRQADWIISYGGDLSKLGIPLSRTVEVSPGLALGEVAR